ncbi:MAG: DUF928 domain-containing protein [Microcoleaceae cyanobacterium]
MGTALFGVVTDLALANHPNTETSEIHLATQTNSWEEIEAAINSGQRRRGGSRGEICTIAPGQSMTIEAIWTLKPTFIWQGNVARVELHLQESDIDTKPLWSWTKIPQESPVNYVVVQYDGEPLTPGQTYEWRVFETATSSRMAMPPVQFKVVDTEQHRQIQTELNQLKLSPVDSSERMTLERANYFTQKQLWADALQEIYGVKNPSPELNRVAERLTSQFCRS